MPSAQANSRQALEQAWGQPRRGLSTPSGLPRPWTAFEVAHERQPPTATWTPSASTAPWKTGKRPPVFHSANRPTPRQCLSTLPKTPRVISGPETPACQTRQSVTHVAGLFCYLSSRSHRAQTRKK
jgi:hypothetical protein